MEMNEKTKTVTRDLLCIGEVAEVKSIGLKRVPGSDDLHKLGETGAKSREMALHSWNSCRSILFVPNKLELATDLLYRGPYYPILNISDNEACLNSEVVINSTYNLSALLKFFGYSEFLTYDDIKEIHERFFSGGFAKNNCALFGWRESLSRYVTLYFNGDEIKNPRAREKERRVIREGDRHRMFIYEGNGKLPKELFDVINERESKEIYDNGILRKIDAFAPAKVEGNFEKVLSF